MRIALPRAFAVVQWMDLVSVAVDEEERMVIGPAERLQVVADGHDDDWRPRVSSLAADIPMAFYNLLDLIPSG
jgi:hypothetical protein